MANVKVHEHIIGLGECTLSRALLWEGLERFARHPDQYVAHMEGAKVTAETRTDCGVMLSRQISFGNFTLRDAVLLSDSQTLLTMVEAGDGWPSSTFLIKIEEPESGHLFLRFVYEEDDSARAEANPEMLKLRRQAYEAKDRDLVEKILEEIRG